MCIIGKHYLFMLYALGLFDMLYMCFSIGKYVNDIGLITVQGLNESHVIPHIDKKR